MPYRRRSLVLAEIVRQCRFALKAYGWAADAIALGSEDTLWPAVEALLGAAAHLHQLLWPQSESAVASAGELRTALGIGPDSPLARSELRDLSNLAVLVEAWTENPRGAVRAFRREESKVRYYGIQIDLPPLLAAIAALDERALNEAQQMRQMV